MKAISRKSFFLACLSFFISPLAHSEGYYKDKDGDPWFVGIGVGNTWLSLANNTQVNNGFAAPPASTVDNYTISTPTIAIGQIEFGRRIYRDGYNFFPVYHLFGQYRHFFNSNISGNVDQFSLPGFVNYNYSESYEADMFTFNGKWDLTRWGRFLPYVTAGVGFVINHLNDYSESPTAGVAPRISPNFQGNTMIKPAGVLGLGFDFILNGDVWATVGYDHVFQGDIKTGEGVGPWVNTVLDFGNAKMDTVYINLAFNLPFDDGRQA